MFFLSPNTCNGNVVLWCCLDGATAVSYQSASYVHQFVDVADTNMYVVAFTMIKRTNIESLYPPLDRTKRKKLVREDKIEITVHETIQELLTDIRGSHVMVGTRGLVDVIRSSL